MKENITRKRKKNTRERLEKISEDIFIMRSSKETKSLNQIGKARESTF